MSRIKRAEKLGLKTQKEYEDIINEIAEIRIDKLVSYGEDRYSKKEGFDFDMHMCFSDVFRKYIRLKQLIKILLVTARDGETLRDTLLDLANYVIMWIQIYDSYKKELK